jgi:hypothetical protein
MVVQKAILGGQAQAQRSVNRQKKGSNKKDSVWRGYIMPCTFI